MTIRIKAMCCPILFSFGHERQIIRKIAAQMPGQDARLDERHLSHAQVLFQQRMVEALLFPFLVRFDDELATRVRELDRAAFPLVEVSRADLLAIDERDGEPIRQPRPNSSMRSNASDGRFGRSTWKKPTNGSKPTLVNAAMQSCRTSA